MKDAPPDFEEMVAPMDRWLRETSAGEVPTPRLMEALQSNDGRLTLGECLHRRMRLLYAEKSGVWSNYCRQGEAVDFRGGAVRTYAREVRLNLRMVVNDDLEAFESMPDRRRHIAGCFQVCIGSGARPAADDAQLDLVPGTAVGTTISVAHEMARRPVIGRIPVHSLVLDLV